MFKFIDELSADECTYTYKWLLSACHIIKSLSFCESVPFMRSTEDRINCSVLWLYIFDIIMRFPSFILTLATAKQTNNWYTVPTCPARCDVVYILICTYQLNIAVLNDFNIKIEFFVRDMTGIIDSKITSVAGKRLNVRTYLIGFLYVSFRNNSILNRRGR